MGKLFALLSLSLSVLVYGANSDQIVDIGNTGEPGTLDPHLYFTNLEEHILKDLFVGLTTMAADGQIIPGCASTWTISEDQKTWTFTLRNDLLWSDGQPLTARDFEYGFQRLLNPETAASLAFFLYGIKNAQAVNSGKLEPNLLGVRATDDLTLVVELDQPFPFFTERLLYPIAYPVPSHVIENFGSNWIKEDNWVSNGPYVLKEWRPHEYVELRKNVRFYAASEVQVETVKYYPTTQAATAYNRYLAGELDVISDYPKGVFESLQSTRGDEMRNVPLQSIMYLVFNTRKPPFDDVRVRKALALAIDRDIIVDKMLGLGELPSTTLSPPIVDNYMPVGYDDKQDITEAKRLLSEAGFEDRTLELELRHIANDETRNVYVAIASMWNQVGVVTKLHHSTLADHFGNLNVGNFEIGQAGWFGENNPEHYIELLSSTISSANYGKYQSETFDKLLVSAKAEADLATRVRLLNEAETVALKDYPVIPLYVVLTRNLVNPNLKGWLPNGRNLHPARYYYWD